MGALLWSQVPATHHPKREVGMSVFSLEDDKAALSLMEDGRVEQVRSSRDDVDGEPGSKVNEAWGAPQPMDYQR